MSIVFLHWQHYNILVSENKISRKLQISCFQYIQRKVGQRTQRCIIFYLSQRDSYSHFQLRMQLWIVSALSKLIKFVLKRGPRIYHSKVLL